jgi:hypothetical protein
LRTRLGCPSLGPRVGRGCATAEKIGKASTIEEDEPLREMVVSEADLVDIANSLDRTEKAVKARAYILRLLLRRFGIRRRGLSRLG